MPASSITVANMAKTPIANTIITVSIIWKGRSLRQELHQVCKHLKILSCLSPISLNIE